MAQKFNEVLKGLRKESKMSQEEFAKIINVTQRTYSHYEKGDREPSIDTILKIADYYRIPTDVLLGRYQITRDTERK